MSHPPIGIDLGTSTSIVSYFVDGKPVPIPDPQTKTPIVPSVVGLTRSGELLVGQRAIDRSFDNMEVREAKRGMGKGNRYQLGNQSYSAEEVAAVVLRYLKGIAEGRVGRPVRDVVLTVPANYTDERRKATMAAAAMADLNVVRLVNEPTAAAMAFGIDNQDKEGLFLVYDFGGGTLDVTVLEMIAGVLEVKTSWGVEELGGKDFDERIMEWAHARFMAAHPTAQTVPAAEKMLKRAAEEAKKDLSSVLSASVHVDNYAEDGGSDVDLDEPITRPQFEQLIADLIAKSLTAVDEALERAGVGRSEISQVLLVGGATWVPAVRNAVIDHMGRPAVAGCDPDLAVSLGACVSAAIGAGYISPEKGLVVQDVSTYGLGTLMVTDIGGRRVLAYDELMPPNTPVPFTTTCGGYHLQRLDQDAMHVSLVQDITPDGSAVRPDETHCITEGELVGIPPSRTSEPHEVELQFSYDTNGIVVLTASLPSLEKQLTLQHQLRAGTSTPSASLDRVDELWDQAPLAQKHATWVRRAEEHLATDPPNAEALSTALVSLKTHISMNDATQAEEARGRLIELLADA